MYNLEVYEDARGFSPIQAFIEELDASGCKDARIQLEQLQLKLGLLQELGTRTSNQINKYIRDGIWELKAGKNRVLFFIWVDNYIVLLHPFRKETQKTPNREIEKAMRERDDWVSRHGNS